MRGPFGPAILKELIEGGAISQETIAGDSETGPWIPLGRHGIAIDLFQPKRVFGLKATEFDRANTVGSPPVDHRDMIRAADIGTTVRKQGEPEPARAPNDVEVLVQKTAATNAAREAPMVFVKRENRRLRDFWFLMLVGNGTGGVLLFAFRHDPILLVGVISIMTVFTAGATWIMWAIMDRY